MLSARPIFYALQKVSYLFINNSTKLHVPIDRDVIRNTITCYHPGVPLETILARLNVPEKSLVTVAAYLSRKSDEGNVVCVQILAGLIAKGQLSHDITSPFRDTEQGKNLVRYLFESRMTFPITRFLQNLQRAYVQPNKSHVEVLPSAKP
jgi:hypothetical protein